MRFPAAASIVVFTSSLIAVGCSPDSVITEAPVRAAQRGHANSQASTAVVSAFVCAVIFDGSWTVPAGAEIVVDQRWEAKNQGLVQMFLNAQSATLGVNGGNAADVSRAWEPIVRVPADGVYRTELSVPTGVILTAGQSTNFDLALSLSFPIHDGFTLVDGATHKPLFFGPGIAFDFPCTVTAE